MSFPTTRPEVAWSSRSGYTTYQDGLAGSLDAIEAQEERRGIGRAAVCLAMPLGVNAETLQEERDAVLRLVVHDFGHCE